MCKPFFLGILLFTLFMLSYSCCVYSQTSKETLKIEEGVYNYKETDTTRTDTLTFSIQWDFRSISIPEADSLNLSKILLNLCLHGNRSIRVIYWDFELDEYSERLFKRRGERLFKFMQSHECLKQINMIVRYEIIKAIDGSDMRYPYNQPFRTVMIIVDE